MATSSPFTTGNDKKTGTATAETFSGLGGNDDIKGMGGKDTISGGTGADLIDGGVGDDVLKGDAGKDTLRGGVDDDSIEGGIDNDLLDGGNGNDTLNGGAGKDTMTGGEGNDTYIVDNIGDKVTDVTTGTKGGTDLVSSSINYVLGAKIEKLTLTGEKDLTGTGNDEKNVINGNAGSNKLNGGKGNDTINGGEGDDTIDGGTGVDKLTGGDGSDVYVVSNNEDIITETAVDGDDDEVQSSAADYELNAYVERLTLIGKGKDGIGNELDNTLDGNGLDNELNGDAGNDTITGNAGNDILDGGAGDDEIDGGDGDDVVTYQGSIEDYKIIDEGDQWIVEDTTGIDGEDGVDEGIDTITNVEMLQFVDGVYPGGDDDGDAILGTEDDDTLTGTEDDDTIDGLDGYDTVIYEGSIDEYEITDEGDGQIIVDGNDGVDTLINIEEVQFEDGVYPNGGGDSDVILGTKGDDVLIGTDDDDTIDGLGGYDIVTYEGSLEEYIIDEWDGQVVVSGNEGIDTITNIEELQFYDGSHYIYYPEDPVIPPVSGGELPTVQFDFASSLLEGYEGETIGLTVTLSAPVDEDVTVTYTTTDSLATVDVDYWVGLGDSFWYDDAGNEWIEETLTFAPGETTQSILVDLYSDSEIEYYEGFSVTLSNPVNAVLNASNIAFVGIYDA